MLFRIFLVIIFIISCRANAQESVLAAGGSASGADGAVSFSVGQAAFITATGADGTSSEGVQQPYEIIFMPGMDDDPAITLTSRVYPNPTSGRLSLSTVTPVPDNLRYDLTDLNGTLLQTNKITLAETILELGQLVPASYYLTVFSQGRVVKTYKIIRK